MEKHRKKVQNKYKKKLKRNKNSNKIMKLSTAKIVPTNNSAKESSIDILTTNAAGMKYKETNLKNKIGFFNCSVFTIQETHYAKKGKFKFDKFVIFESIRKSRMKRGSMLGVNVDLNPVLVKEYSDDFELVVVEVKAGNTSIRIMTGYGPQENWEYKDKTPFFEALESEITCAELEGKPEIISLDAKSKLGSRFIDKDPHEQSRNGKLLADILERHALVVVNGLKEKCTGLITRERRTVDGTERSVIDFVITSSILVKHIDKMHIDDGRVNVLTSI